MPQTNVQMNAGGDRAQRATLARDRVSVSLVCYRATSACRLRNDRKFRSESRYLDIGGGRNLENPRSATASAHRPLARRLSCVPMSFVPSTIPNTTPGDLSASGAHSAPLARDRVEIANRDHFSRPRDSISGYLPTSHLSTNRQQSLKTHPVTTGRSGRLLAARGEGPTGLSLRGKIRTHTHEAALYRYTS